MYINKFIPVNTRLKPTVSLWAGRIMLVLTFVFGNMSRLQQTYDSFYLSAFGALGFSAKVALLSVIFSGIALGFIMYAIYSAAARFAYIALQRKLLFVGETGVDYNSFRTFYDWPVIAAGLLGGIFELLNVFYPAVLVGSSYLLSVLFSLAAILIATALLVRKCGKDNLWFCISSVTLLNVIIMVL